MANLQVAQWTKVFLFDVVQLDVLELQFIMTVLIAHNGDLAEDGRYFAMGIIRLNHSSLFRAGPGSRSLDVIMVQDPAEVAACV